MPLVTVHLLALAPNVQVDGFLEALQASNIRPLVKAKPVRWIIRPEQLSVEVLLGHKWSLMLILPAVTTLPPAYTNADWVTAQWSITAGVPSALLDGFADKNHKLLHPTKDRIPPLTGSIRDGPRKAASAQGLELSDELLTWSENFQLGRTGAVSMLNLLKFTTAADSHRNYQTYGKAFAQKVGKRRGGIAKIVGKVVRRTGLETSDGEDVQGWDEVALAHYPTIHHFVDMLGSDDYQEVNHAYRLPSLQDTCILCTTELDPEVLPRRAML